jgi:hypothetical protein
MNLQILYKYESRKGDGPVLLASAAKLGKDRKEVQGTNLASRSIRYQGTGYRYRVAGKGEREVNVGQLKSCYVLWLPLLSNWEG